MRTMTTLRELSIAEGREIGARYPWAITGTRCDETASLSRRTWTCTRPEDHDGPHVAHTPGGSAVVMWDAA